MFVKVKVQNKDRLDIEIILLFIFYFYVGIVKKSFKKYNYEKISVLYIEGERVVDIYSCVEYV